MYLIGLAGKAYSGKTTVAELLCELYRERGCTCVIIPFAQALKEKAREFGWDGRKDAKGRRFLQLLGTEIGRAYDNDYWVKEWLRRAEASGADVVIADDVRFDNEALVIESMRGEVWVVSCQDSARKARAEAKGEQLPPQHASEQGIEPCFQNVVILNDTTLDALRVLVANSVQDSFHATATTASVDLVMNGKQKN